MLIVLLVHPHNVCFHSSIIVHIHAHVMYVYTCVCIVQVYVHMHCVLIHVYDLWVLCD